MPLYYLLLVKHEVKSDPLFFIRSACHLNTTTFMVFCLLNPRLLPRGCLKKKLVA